MEKKNMHIIQSFMFQWNGEKTLGFGFGVERMSWNPVECKSDCNKVTTITRIVFNAQLQLRKRVDVMSTKQCIVGVGVGVDVGS